MMLGSDSNMAMEIELEAADRIIRNLELRIKELEAGQCVTDDMRHWHQRAYALEAENERLRAIVDAVIDGDVRNAIMCFRIEALANDPGITSWYRSAADALEAHEEEIGAD